MKGLEVNPINPDPRGNARGNPQTSSDADADFAHACAVAYANFNPGGSSNVKEFVNTYARNYRDAYDIAKRISQSRRT